MPTLCESVMKLRSTKQAATPKRITEYIWATTSDASLRPDMSTVRRALKLAVKQRILQRSRDGTYRINLKAVPDDTIAPVRRHRTQHVDLHYRSRSRHGRGRRSRRKHRRSNRRHRRRSHSRRSSTYSYAALSPCSKRHCKSHFNNDHLYGTYYYDY